MSEKIIGITVGTQLPKPDFAQTDPTKGDYIKNKPDVEGLNAKVDAIGEALANHEHSCNEPYKQFVTNARSEAVWEDRPHVNDRIVLKLDPERDVLTEDGAHCCEYSETNPKSVNDAILAIGAEFRKCEVNALRHTFYLDGLIMSSSGARRLPLTYGGLLENAVTIAVTKDSSGAGVVKFTYTDNKEHIFEMLRVEPEIRPIETRLLPQALQFGDIGRVEVLPKTIITFTDGVYEGACDISLMVGQTYTIIWNDAEFSCVCFTRDVDGAVVYCLGNISYIGGENTREPFFISFSSETGLATFVQVDNFSLSSNNIATLSIYSNDGITKIDNKYLPDTVQRTITGTAGQFVVIGDDGNVTTKDIAQDTVRYTEQTLTEDQQLQARTNIGIIEAGESEALELLAELEIATPVTDGDVIYTDEQNNILII